MLMITDQGSLILGLYVIDTFPRSSNRMQCMSMRFELLCRLDIDLLSRISSNDAHVSWFVHCTFDVMEIEVSLYRDLLNDIRLKLK